MREHVGALPDLFAASAARRDRFVEEIEKGATVREAAAAVGVSFVAAYKWMRKDPDFRSRVRFARALPDLLVKNALYKAAVEGNVQAGIFWMSRRNPDTWGTRVSVETSNRIEPGKLVFEITPAPTITLKEVRESVPIED